VTPPIPSGKFVMVGLKAVQPLKTPVSLATLKGDPRFAEMALLKYSRLSVQPVTDSEWDMILAYGAM